MSGSSSSSARVLRRRIRSMAALSAMRWIQESSAASPRNSSRWFQALSRASWTASAARSASRVIRRQALYQRTLRSLSTAWKASGRTQDFKRVSTQLGRPSRQKVSKARKLLLFDGLERREVHPAAQVPGDHADLLLFGFPGVRHHEFLLGDADDILLEHEPEGFGPIRPLRHDDFPEALRHLDAHAAVVVQAAEPAIPGIEHRPREQ